MKLSLRSLERHVPPGVSLVQELGWLAVGGGSGLLYSLRFLGDYLMAYQSLFVWEGTRRILDTSKVMPDFVEVLGNSLNGFLLLALCMLPLLIYHYTYHYQGSKSIYLMKRLPSRWELPRRCITLPLLGVTASLVAALLLLLLYFAVYLAFTPRACLSPGQWQKLWSALVGVAR
jgi:hypothetical protein